MPFVIRKLPCKNLYSVKNKITGAIHSKGSTLENAKAQVRLLHMIDREATGGNLEDNLNDAIETALNLGLFSSYDEAKSVFEKSTSTNIPFSILRNMNNFNPDRLQDTAEKSYPMNNRPRGKADIDSVKYSQNLIRNNSPR